MNTNALQSKIWREAAKIAREHGAEHDAQAKKLEAGPESMWASKAAQLGVVANLAHIAMECECLASVFEGKADELRKGGGR